MYIYIYIYIYIYTHTQINWWKHLKQAQVPIGASGGHAEPNAKRQRTG